MVTYGGMSRKPLLVPAVSTPLWSSPPVSYSLWSVCLSVCVSDLSVCLSACLTSLHVCPAGLSDLQQPQAPRLLDDTVEEGQQTW